MFHVYCNAFRKRLTRAKRVVNEVSDELFSVASHDNEEIFIERVRGERTNFFGGFHENNFGGRSLFSGAIVWLNLANLKRSYVHTLSSKLIVDKLRNFHQHAADNCFISCL